jgi:hypothetical protein
MRLKPLFSRISSSYEEGLISQKTSDFSLLRHTAFLLVSAVLVILILDGCAATPSGEGSSESASNVTSTTTSTTTYIDSNTDRNSDEEVTTSDDQTSDGVTQGYWYCWDSGDPKPHHLGYHVSGDHLCTDRELSEKFPASRFPATSSNDGDRVTQGYWYCWDSGDPKPHHLGHYVSGDHLCTDGELHDAGLAGY